MYGDYLAKEFVLSLKEIAFDWYSDFQPIDSWERLEQEFLNRFYSTRRVVSMMELTKARQGENVLGFDFINRSRSLSLKCKDRRIEISSIKMCIQDMIWGLHFILQGLKHNTFVELTTRAHDIELSMT